MTRDAQIKQLYADMFSYKAHTAEMSRLEKEKNLLKERINDALFALSKPITDAEGVTRWIYTDTDHKATLTESKRSGLSVQKLIELGVSPITIKEATEESEFVQLRIESLKVKEAE